MSEDDVLFGYRLQLVDLAGRVGVSAACRTFGVHRSTYYRWKRMIERHGLEILRPRERRAPRMPNQLSPLVEQRIVIPRRYGNNLSRFLEHTPLRVTQPPRAFVVIVFGRRSGSARATHASGQDLGRIGRRGRRKRQDVDGGLARTDLYHL